MKQVPEVFDWVTARVECSVGRMFVLLTERVESDVTLMQAHVDKARRRLTFNRVADARFIVAVEQIDGNHVFGGRGVMFKRTNSGIVVDMKVSNKPDQVLFEAKAALSVEGKCHYEVAGQSLELWQVSRKALEDLLFE